MITLSDLFISVSLYFVFMGGFFACFMCADLLRSGLKGQLKIK